MIDQKTFKTGGEFTAWIGLVQRQNSTGAREGWAQSLRRAIANCNAY
jgi:hypothetical protein